MANLNEESLPPAGPPTRVGAPAPSMPFLCPKCDGLVGRTDGTTFTPENGAESNPQPDLTVIISCPCGHKWPWPH